MKRRVPREFCTGKIPGDLVREREGERNSAKGEMETGDWRLLSSHHRSPIPGFRLEHSKHSKHWRTHAHRHTQAHGSLLVDNKKHVLAPRRPRLIGLK